MVRCWFAATAALTGTGGSVVDAAVAFDLDGTLVRLPVDIDAVRVRLASHFGRLGYSGGFWPVLPGIDTAAAQLGQTDGERAEHRRQGRALIDEAELAAATTLQVCDGALPLLADLSARGIPLGIVTNNGRACLGRCLESLEGAAWTDAALVTRDDARWKPAPEGVERAYEALLPRGGRLIYVGDSASDAEAVSLARTGGRHIRMIGVQGGAGSAADLQLAGADIVVPNLITMLDALDDYLS